MTGDTQGPQGASVSRTAVHVTWGRALVAIVLAGSGFTASTTYTAVSSWSAAGALMLLAVLDVTQIGSSQYVRMALATAAVSCALAVAIALGADRDIITAMLATGGIFGGITLMFRFMERRLARH